MAESQVTTTFAPTAALYRLNSDLALRAIADVEPKNLTIRPNDTMNSFTWILGHITRTRYGIAKMCGLKVEIPFGKTFARGEAAGDSATYPSIGEIKSKYTDICAQLNERFAEMSDGELDAQIDAQYPMQEKTLRGALTFLMFHESTHIGQLMYLRRYFGYSGLVG